MKRVWVIGNSDGIGLALTRMLLEDPDRQVTGLSRSASPIEHARYTHHELDVSEATFNAWLTSQRDAQQGPPDLCVFCVGIGDPLDLNAMEREPHVFEVNLVACVALLQHLVPAMVERGSGHVIALSSQADRFIDGGAPSYNASKAGLSSYLEGLALAVRNRGVYITNVRLGFVDTKMAKSPVKPFMMSADKAAQLIMRCIRKRPIRLTRPRRMAMLLWFAAWPARLKIWFS